MCHALFQKFVKGREYAPQVLITRKVKEHGITEGSVTG